jgi:hypothetical protein
LSQLTPLPSLAAVLYLGRVKVARVDAAGSYSSFAPPGGVETLSV